jgi:PEP-CTERM motif
MERVKKLLYAAAVATCLAGAASARADISWTADWTPSNNFIAVGPSTNINFSNLAATNYTTSSALPVVSVPATNLTISSSASSTVTFSGAVYSLSLKITDGPSGATGIFNFTGTLSGTITQTGAWVNNVFNTPTSITKTIGADTYTVTLSGYVPPGTPTSINTVGGIGATITVVPGNSSGSPHGTPEPSTLVLAGLGMAFTGLGAWRRKRNAGQVE